MTSTTELAHRIADATLRRVRTSYPAVVTRYDPTSRTADVLLGQVGASADGVPEVPHPLLDVPVAWMRCAGMVVAGNLLPGDEVLVSVCARSIDAFQASGVPAPLNSDRLHDWSDAYVEPRQLSRRVPPTSSEATHLTIGREDGTATITIAINGSEVVVQAPSIRLGSAATPVTDAVAVARLVHEYLANLFAAGVPVPNDGGAALQTAWQVYMLTNPFADMASSVAAAEV